MATDRKTIVKNYIQEHGETKTIDLVKAFGLSDGYVRTVLRELVHDGTIEKIGDKRYAKYRIKT